MGSLWNSLRLGMRILVRRPVFAATIILVLGVGIGANILVFSVVDAVLLRPLPYPQPHQLVWISQGVSPTHEEYVLAPDFLVWRSQLRSFSHMAAFFEQYQSLVGGNHPERMMTARVSVEFLSLLGIQPLEGRGVLSEEDHPGGRRVAILTHGAWVRWFGSKPIIGEIIKLDDEPFEVIGILPQNFRFPEPLNVEVLVPLALGEDQATRQAAAKTGAKMVKVIARLKPGVTIEQAQAELNILQHAIVRAFPLQEGKEARLQPLHECLTGDIKHTLLILLGAVGLLWILGCLNVGHFLLARATSRQADMAVCLALGASRRHLFGQLLIENAMLTLLGSLLGLLLAFWGHDLLVSIVPHRVFGIAEVHLDAWMVGFATLSFALTTLLVSLVAARAFPLQNISYVLKSGAANVIGSLRLRHLLDSIVVVELALAVCLLVGAGLMIRSFWALRYRHLGFEADRVLTLRLDLPLLRYPEHRQQATFFETVMQRAAQLPDVDSVALCSSAPPIAVGSLFGVSIEGHPLSPSAAMKMARFQAVSSAYFRVLGVPLVEGRMLSDGDGEQSPLVVVVNRSFVRHYLAHERVVGKRIRIGGSLAPWRTIIGVVEDFKNVGLAADPEPEIYSPYWQFPWLPGMYVIARTSTASPLIFFQLSKL